MASQLCVQAAPDQPAAHSQRAVTSLIGAQLPWLPGPETAVLGR
jgi:hypothetical protein